MARNPALGIPPSELVRIRIPLSLGSLHVPEGAAPKWPGIPPSESRPPNSFGFESD